LQSYYLFAEKFGRPAKGNGRPGSPRTGLRPGGEAKSPVVKTMDSFDFLAMPTLNKTLVLELARCEFLARHENVLLSGNSGTGNLRESIFSMPW
jgi:hypothetical protein